jgi:predicted phosphodiesterase
MIAILSDIHSNLEALTIALDSLVGEDISAIYCTGDLVEYPEEANGVISLIRQGQVKCVMGNNDSAYMDQLDCSDEVQNDSDRPWEEITETNLSFLEQLPAYLSEPELYLVHALPPNSFLKYIDNQREQSLLKAFGSFSQSIAFVGHTHEYKIYELTVSGEIRKHEFVNPEFYLNPGSRYIINAGSVGQARRLNHELGYLLYDLEQQRIIRKLI